MKKSGIAIIAISASLLAGCTVSRGDCEFMLQTERERCLHANASSEQALKQRAAAMRKEEKPFTIQKDKTDESRSSSPAP